MCFLFVVNGWNDWRRIVSYWWWRCCGSWILWLGTNDTTTLPRVVRILVCISINGENGNGWASSRGLTIDSAAIWLLLLWRCTMRADNDHKFGISSKGRRQRRRRPHQFEYNQNKIIPDQRIFEREVNIDGFRMGKNTAHESMGLRGGRIEVSLGFPQDSISFSFVRRFF